MVTLASIITVLFNRVCQLWGIKISGTLQNMLSNLEAPTEHNWSPVHLLKLEGLFH